MNFMSKRTCDWGWEYFKLEGIDYEAKCCICNKIYQAYSTKNFRIHIMVQHNKVYQSDAGREANWERQFCIIQSDNIKCKLCDSSFPLSKTIMAPMKKHLFEMHDVTEHTTVALRNWMSKHFIIINGQMTCKSCNYIYGRNNLYNSMKHLIDAHLTNVPSEIKPRE